MSDTILNLGTAILNLGTAVPCTALDGNVRSVGALIRTRDEFAIYQIMLDFMKS